MIEDHKILCSLRFLTTRCPEEDKIAYQKATLLFREFTLGGITRESMDVLTALFFSDMTDSRWSKLLLCHFSQKLPQIEENARDILSFEDANAYFLALISVDGVLSLSDQLLSVIEEIPSITSQGVYYEA